MFSVGDATIDLTLEGATTFNSQCEQAKTQLSGLQGGLVATDTKAKNFLVTLREFSSGAGLGMLIRGGIYGILAAGAVDALADMTRAAKEGKSAVEVLGTGFLRLAESLPVIGRMATAFKKLSDEITGAREAKEMLDKALAFKKGVGEMEEETKLAIAKIKAKDKEAAEKLDIENEYQKSIKELREKADKAQITSGINPVVKLRQELEALEKMSEYHKRIYRGFTSHTMGVEPTTGHSLDYEKALSEKKELLQSALANDKKYNEELNNLAIKRELDFKELHNKYIEEARKKDEEIAKKEDAEWGKAQEARSKMEDYLTAGAGEKQKKIAEETAKYAEAYNAATTIDERNNLNKLHKEALANIEKEAALKEEKIREEVALKFQKINDELSLSIASEKQQETIRENIRHTEMDRNIRAQKIKLMGGEEGISPREMQEQLEKEEIAHQNQLAEIKSRQQKKDVDEAKRIAKEQENYNLEVIRVTKGAKEEEFAREEYRVAELLNQKLITQKEAAEDLAKKHKEIFDKKEFRSMFIVPIESAWSQLATRFAGGKEAATELTQQEIATAVKTVARLMEENKNKNKNPNKTPVGAGLGVAP